MTLVDRLLATPPHATVFALLPEAGADRVPDRPLARAAPVGSRPAGPTHRARPGRDDPDGR